ncbi:hypothetical protein CAPTEDRAFT_189315 [Capitella teleta]|uniref:Uncharacterized protein n=1 Tax=Capitella teleta TaxID=283909 RepID=R7UTH0_CAPTE|nr:hypothetical protein CAPTEDRAFT_189315 [Capitella teleta]|eukprot:ELU06681.1 hypothetical protein CAPTEDRAFT_189315 [Capitella teleta]
MACGREERSDCCDSKTKSDQYGECIDESFEYTRNEEENDRTRDAGTEYGGANVDNANQWIVHWNPVKSKLNEMRPDPPACIAHTSINIAEAAILPIELSKELSLRLGDKSMNSGRRAQLMSYSCTKQTIHSKCLIPNVCLNHNRIGLLLVWHLVHVRKI